MAFYNRVYFSTTSTGTTAFVAGAPLQGFQTPAIIPDGTPISYTAQQVDSNNNVIAWETGHGTWHAAGNVSRDTPLQGSGGIPVNFLSSPNVFFDLLAEDVATFQLATGVINGSNAAVGNLGEYRSTIVSTNQALTSGTPLNVCTLSLPAGDWDVEGEGWLIAGTTAPTYVAVAITTTTATLPTMPADATGYSRFYGALTISQTSVFPVKATRLSLSATTNVYLVMLVGVIGCNAQGIIRARRMR